MADGGPFVVLLGEDGADQSDHGDFVGEDLCDVRALFEARMSSRLGGVGLGPCFD